MKKFYTKMMALACMFMLAGANAWGTVETWTGGTSVNPTDGEWFNLPGTSVSILCGDYTYDHGIHGIKFGQVHGYHNVSDTYGYLKSAKNGVITVTIQSVKTDEHFIVTDPNGVSFTTDHSQASNNVEGDGVSVTFEVKAGLEYFMQMSSTNHFWFKKVELYDEAEILTLDETTANATNKSTISSSTSKRCIKLNRTLKGGIWNTFCLPMTIQAEQLVISDGVYALGSYNSGTQEVTFTKSTTLQANTPYLIMPAADVVNPSFVGTIVNASTPTASSNGLNFVGVYGTEDIYTTGDDSSTKFYLNGTGHFVYPTSNEGNNGTIKGFRAYFEWTNGVPAHSNVKAMTFTFEDDATGIIKVENDPFQENGNVYTIDGRNMGNAKNLSRGLYIQNGRKFVVK